VYGEEKILSTRPRRAAKAWTKISRTGTTSQTNQPRKDPFQFVLFLSLRLPQFQQVALAMWLRPLPAVRDLTHDGRWSTYDVSVLKLYNVSFRGRCARTGHPLKLPSLTKLARPGHFPPASQAGRLAGPVFYVYVFSMAGTPFSVLSG
jgi:hypothetical protein